MFIDPFLNIILYECLILLVFVIISITTVIKYSEFSVFSIKESLSIKSANELDGPLYVWNWSTWKGAHFLIIAFRARPEHAKYTTL